MVTIKKKKRPIPFLLKHATLAASDMKNTSTRSATDKEHSAWTFREPGERKYFEFIHLKKVLIQIVPENKGNISLSEEAKMTHCE